MSITRKYLNQLAPQLSPRDLAIISEVGRFKIMTGGQVERLFFADCSDTSRARNRQAVLRRLTEHRVLARVGERRVGGAQRGSASFLYTLDVAGQHLSQGTSTRPRRPYSWYEPTIGHFLGVAELYVVLREADQSGLFSLLNFQTEPYCWRTFGQRTLKPDAFTQVGIVTADGRRRKGSFFIEVDRANQYGAKIETKVPQYVAYYQHDRLAQPERAFPRIVFLVPDQQRAEYLSRLVQSRPEVRQLFSVGLLEDPIAALLRF
ncbi:replication-relaxation family protein [Streptomyces sp. TLI_146]|uniref:replication-relaxation family protein n=1 Tax=Streptomyces sp. TLI_146 TaxID=1938858 RepID=UPI000C710EF3|nr:replication-relaxation family protein [Streptomyces sp. TLI_146]PKV88172.1 protein involved in plasmid replication-relaxation [Streptomyces sp. TLI_146]